MHLHKSEPDFKLKPIFFLSPSVEKTRRMRHKHTHTQTVLNLQYYFPCIHT